jgi:hypothetical protein
MNRAQMHLATIGSIWMILMKMAFIFIIGNVLDVTLKHQQQLASHLLSNKNREHV